MENDDTTKMTTAVRLALMEQAQTQMNGKLDTIIDLVQAQNGRVRRVEDGELQCKASGILDLPGRVRVLEDNVKKQEGAIAVAKWFGGGGGLAGFLGLLQQIFQIIK